MIRKTDIKIAKGIYVSYSAYTNYFKRSRNIAMMIQLALPKFRLLLELENKLVFRIAPLKGTTKGRYYSDTKVVELDCRLRNEKAMCTLAHELVHVEQYKQKRLQQKKRQGRYVFFWRGEATRKNYWEQPWEIEARLRQVKLAECVATMIVKDMENESKPRTQRSKNTQVQNAGGRV